MGRGVEIIYFNKKIFFFDDQYDFGQNNNDIELWYLLMMYSILIFTNVETKGPLNKDLVNIFSDYLTYSGFPLPMKSDLISDNRIFDSWNPFRGTGVVFTGSDEDFDKLKNYAKENINLQSFIYLISLYADQNPNEEGFYRIIFATSVLKELVEIMENLKNGLVTDFKEIAKNQNREINDRIIEFLETLIESLIVLSNNIIKIGPEIFKNIRNSKGDEIENRFFSAEELIDINPFDKSNYPKNSIFYKKF